MAKEQHPKIRLLKHITAFRYNTIKVRELQVKTEIVNRANNSPKMFVATMRDVQSVLNLQICEWKIQVVNSLLIHFMFALSLSLIPFYTRLLFFAEASKAPIR